MVFGPSTTRLSNTRGNIIVLVCEFVRVTVTENEGTLYAEFPQNEIEKIPLEGTKSLTFHSPKYNDD